MAKKKKTADDNHERSEMKSVLTDIFELPEELTLDMPRITLVGNIRLEIENHKGIIDYTAEGIKVRVNGGFLWGRGTNLVLRNICADEIILEGQIAELGIYLDKTESE